MSKTDQAPSILIATSETVPGELRRTGLGWAVPMIDSGLTARVLGVEPYNIGIDTDPDTWRRLMEESDGVLVATEDPEGEETFPVDDWQAEVGVMGLAHSLQIFFMGNNFDELGFADREAAVRLCQGREIELSPSARGRSIFAGHGMKALERIERNIRGEE